MVQRVTTAIDNHWAVFAEWQPTGRDTKLEIIELVLPTREFADALMFGRIGEYGTAAAFAGVGVAKAGLELYGTHLLMQGSKRVFVRVVGADIREVSVTRLVTGPGRQGVVRHSSGSVVKGAGRGVSRSQSFGSFSTFKRRMGSAGAGRQWHHIVEQSQVGRFGPEAIHTTRNIVSLPTEAHRQVNALYSSIRPDITGSTTQTVRQWLSTQSYDEAYQFGQQVIEKASPGVWP